MTPALVTCPTKSSTMMYNLFSLLSRTCCRNAAGRTSAWNYFGHDQVRSRAYHLCEPAEPLATMDDPANPAQLYAAIPLGRMARSEEIARVVSFLASDGASYLAATTIFADGG